MTSLVDRAQRRLGSLGEVGPLALGQWRFTNDDPDAARALVETALDAGLKLVDTADVYGLDWGGTGFGSCEARLGNVLAAAPGLRDRMVLATKGGIVPPTPYDSSPRALRRAVDASQRRLGVDVIDLWQLHRPDLLTHPADVAETLAALRAEGRIREVGVSNHTPAQVAALQAHLPFPIVTNQPEYSAVHLDPLRDGTFDACMRDDIVPLVWSPLAGGRLVSGDGVRPELLAVLDGLAGR
ncbi:MAG: aldo/keto reductase, partial [Ilumatobacteraceae bacterium]